MTANNIATRCESSPCAVRLDEQWAAAVACHRHDAARRRLARAREENRRRVAHFAQSLLVHVKKRELADRAEAILRRAHVAEAARRIAFEIQHGVDEMLEKPRSGDRTVLRHVTHDHDARAARFREADDLRGAFAQLRDGAGRRAHRAELHGLNRIDDEQLRRRSTGQRRVEIRVGDDLETGCVQPEPARARSNLRRRFLGGQIQDGFAMRDVVRELQQQSGLADAWFAA
jgi:hypothetical protein